MSEDALYFQDFLIESGIEQCDLCGNYDDEGLLMVLGKLVCADCLDKGAA